MPSLKLHIIIASVRQNRFGDKPVPWIEALAREAGFDTEVVDLKDYPLPNYNEKGSPNALKGQFELEAGRAWEARLAAADAFIFVTPEYNHGYPASLKNAIDWTYQALSDKPVGFVAYGNVGGARAVEQLREVAGEMWLADVGPAVHIARHNQYLDESGQLKEGALDIFADSARRMLGQLMRWGRALKAMREEAQ